MKDSEHTKAKKSTIADDAKAAKKAELTAKTKETQEAIAQRSEEAKQAKARAEQEKATQKKEEKQPKQQAELKDNEPAAEPTPKQAKAKKNDDAFAIISIVLGATALTGLGWLASIPGLILGLLSFKQSKNRKLSIIAVTVNIISGIVYFLAGAAALLILFLAMLASMSQQTSGQIEIHVTNPAENNGQIHIEGKSQRQIEREKKQKEQQQKAEQEKAAKEKEQAEQQKAAEQQAAQDQPATDE